jgi:hypothetical protein
LIAFAPLQFVRETLARSHIEGIPQSYEQSQAVSAQLVDESDGGLYIVGPNETKAIFVPRNVVALVYFSDRIADSALLRDSK